MIFGLDVSNGNGVVDYDRVAAWRGAKGEQIRFVIAKATEGHTFLDPLYASNRKAIVAAGLVPGAYHFLRPLNGAAIKAQADWFCEWADPNALHALDVEAAGPLDVEGWVRAYRKHYPFKTLWIYTGPDLWRSTSKVPYNAAPFGPLWAAGYRPNAYVGCDGLDVAQAWAKVTGNAGLPWLGYTTWSIMQYASGNARVPGVHGAIDINAFGGTEAQLRAQIGGGKVATLDNDDKAWIAAQFNAQLTALDDVVWNYPIGKSGLNAAQTIQNSLIGIKTLTPLDVQTLAQAVADKLAAGVTVAPIDPAVIKTAFIEVLTTIRLSQAS
jgi:GH25 family lysozyme M1 (1,4-beta-N-acetylmuramidase)